MPRVVIDGVPRRMPPAFIGGRGSNGMAFLLTVRPARSTCMMLLPPSTQNTKVPSAAIQVGSLPTATIWLCVGSQTPPLQIPAQTAPHAPQLLTSCWKWKRVLAPIAKSLFLPPNLQITRPVLRSTL